MKQEYYEKYIKIKTIEKYIQKQHNLKTNIVLYKVSIKKFINGKKTIFQKCYYSIEEARRFKDVIVKHLEHRKVINNVSNN